MQQFDFYDRVATQSKQQKHSYLKKNRYVLTAFFHEMLHKFTA